MPSSRARVDNNLFYKENYSKIFSLGNMGRMWGKIHRQMEKPFNTGHSNAILEIGAGSGEHLPFVKDDFALYIQSDIDISNLPKAAGLVAVA